LILVSTVCDHEIEVFKHGSDRVPRVFIRGLGVDSQLKAPSFIHDRFTIPLQLHLPAIHRRKKTRSLSKVNMRDIDGFVESFVGPIAELVPAGASTEVVVCNTIEGKTTRHGIVFTRRTPLQQYIERDRLEQVDRSGRYEVPCGTVFGKVCNKEEEETGEDGPKVWVDFPVGIVVTRVSDMML
jgi:hypothetical protein